MVRVYNLHIQGLVASFAMVNGAEADLEPPTAAYILPAGGEGFVLLVALSFTGYQTDIDMQEE